MEDNKVKVVNMTKSRVGVNLPELRFKRSWPTMGAAIPVDFKVLEEAIFDPGFSHMIKNGTLHIDDKEARIKLGLEEEGNENSAPIVLNEMQIVGLLKVSSYDKFAETLHNLSNSQIRTICQIAIEKEISDYDKAELLKKYTQIDVRKAIELNRLDKAKE